MKKITNMTSQEIRKKWTPEKLAAIETKNIPSFDTGITDDDYSSGRVKRIGRGLSTFKEYIDKNESAKSKDPKVSVSIRIPESYAVGLRATGRGWQTRVGEYLVNGIKRGDLGKISVK